MDHLGMMMLYAPQFNDAGGYLPGRNINTVFYELDEGLKRISGKVGPQNYIMLAELSARMRMHFEADPKDSTGDTDKGRQCILEMEDILRAANRRKR